MKHFYLKIQGDMPGTQVGSCYASSGEGSPAYLPWVKQSAEHGSYPRSPDQALVFHRRPDKGRLRSVTEKPYQVAGEASRQKAKDTGSSIKDVEDDGRGNAGMIKGATRGGF